MPRRHLFVAVTPTAFGEVLHGRRVAEALAAAGDHVSFVAPAEVQPALAGAPFRRGVLEKLGTSLLDVMIPQLAAAERADTVCLVDLAAVALTFGQQGLSLEALRAIPGIVALDLWNLVETDLVFDFGTTRVPLPRSVLSFPRLVPVPFARPTAAGAYNAWPANRPLSPGDRARVRARYQLDGHVFVLPVAAWQAPERQTDPRALAHARALPPVLVAHVAASGATLVRPPSAPWLPPSPCSRHLAQLPPADFAELVGAADAVITANLSATTIATALAAEVPVIAITSPDFAVWPIGLGALLAPVLRDNPLLPCLRLISPDDELPLAPAPEWKSHVGAYRADVARLPSVTARYAELTSS